MENPSNFMLLPPLSLLLVPSQPWLALHNPHIDWSTNKVQNWSSANHPLAPAEVSVTPFPEETLALSTIPEAYQDLGADFSKLCALSLPPHRPYDCTIDRLPGAPLPSSWLYNLSRLEHEAMETYIGLPTSRYYKTLLPRLYHREWPSQDGSKDSGSGRVAHPHNQEATTTIPGGCQFLPEVHPRL